MNKIFISAIALAALSAPALASAFWPGHVVGVSSYDVLNVRAWPASHSQIVGEYENGDNVSLAGRCKNISTNHSFRIDGGQSANWKFNRMKATNVWCQVMTDEANLGWVRGRFVWPQ
jgi:hypothetical protein